MAVPTVKVVENFLVSPPPGSVLPTTLPLTFFDTPWLFSSTPQLIHFYDFPYPTLYFTNNILPAFKHSLSLALQLFFPLAGTLNCPLPPARPHIRYSDGDSIRLTIAESTGDFHHLLSNNPRDLRQLHTLVPDFPPIGVSDDDTPILPPLLSLQVTVFPNTGISVAITANHISADGRTCHHFLKSWTTILMSKGDISCIGDESRPFYDRDVIKDSNDALTSLMEKNWWLWRSAWRKHLTAPFKLMEEKMIATFVLSRHNLSRLKQWISTQCRNRNEPQPSHLSSFVVTCAFIWICFINSQDSRLDDDDDENSLQHLIFPADCTMKGRFCVPATYFGNCITLCRVSLKRRELVGENGLAVAANSIGIEVKELENGVYRKTAEWFSVMKELIESGPILTVAGCTRLSFNDIDFGWGRPTKVESIHTDSTRVISIFEGRDEQGSVDFSLTFPSVEMEAFISNFEETLKVLS